MIARLDRKKRAFLLRMGGIYSLAILLFSALAVHFETISVRAESEDPPNALGNSANSRSDSLPARIDVVEGNDVRFRRLPPGAGLSQTRVAWVVQDKVGFVWFGTQYGLNRFDGYKSKVFKNEPGRPDSLSCVYIRSLFVDHAGTLWVGCERFLDRFEPATETFAHFRIGTQSSNELSTPIQRISEDRAGVLWLATDKGLYRFDPTTGGTKRYVHDPQDPASLADSRINMAEENRAGKFWVASGGGLEEFDRTTGKVIRRVNHDEIRRFHEDEGGVFWMAEATSACGLATWNPRSNAIKCHAINYKLRGKPSSASISEILEDRKGTIWFSSNGGLLKLDRGHSTIVRYHNNPLDIESLESDSLIFLYQDHEGNIWTCLQAFEPNFFSEQPQGFENFTYQRGNLLDPLVTSIYEDGNGVLWIGSMGGLNRIDRRTGKNTAVPRIENEILAILEDDHGVLFCGTFHEGLRRIDRTTGQISPYLAKSLTHSIGPLMRMIYGHDGNLWVAAYGGVGRLDPATGALTMFTPENQNTLQYQEIKEDGEGYFWLGAQSGLHRFDPRTGQFKIYEHHPDDPKSLSDNRVNSVHFDRRGTLWIGTQNGLDRFDPTTGTFQNYFGKDGLAGDVVSCILEDKRGVLWMGTNNGLSSFDPQGQGFQNFSAADGLPGPDLTGWGACYQSPSGEMFFGGFSGATAFYPDRIVSSSFVPSTVLTDFQLSGKSVPIGGGSPLRQSIALANSITLTHLQNVFSVEFSALSFFNAETNRYRYKLDGLDSDWHQVRSDQRIASYTTLPARTYTFEVQGATARGPWSEPGARLRIQILPAWYQSFWFRAICIALSLLAIWATYISRVKELERRFQVALEARVDERTRIARDLHDTLLQSFNGLLLRFQAVANILPTRPDEAKRRIEGALEQAAQAITEGRDAVHELRSGGLSSIPLGQAVSNFGKELLAGSGPETNPEFCVQVEGTTLQLNPIVRDEAYRIAAEAVRNAIRHAAAKRIEVEIRYDENNLRVRIRDDGKGINPEILGRDHAAGRWGLRGMRERAKLVGGSLEVWSQLDAGTEIELNIPATSAYAKSPNAHRSLLSRFRRSES